MPATLREVSEKLNLSPGLVSRVLNGRPGVRATPQTVERIKRFAAELNYEPSAAAKSLRVGKTNVVAFVNVQPSNGPVRNAFSAAAEGLAECLEAIDYSVLIKMFSSGGDMSSALVTMVRQRSCDAFVLWGDEHDVEVQGELLTDLHVPFVIKGRHEKSHPDWYQIDYDHEGMISACIAHLAGLGHKRIAYICFDPESIFQIRLIDGYISAMTATFGEPPHPEWVASVSPGIQSSEETMLEWLAQDVEARPTACVVGAGANPMWGIERALMREGRVIGDDDGKFAAAGFIRSEVPLLFGEAYGYSLSGASELASVQAERQLKPLLATGEADEHIIRILPEIGPLKSMRLADVSSSRMEKGN